MCTDIRASKRYTNEIEKLRQNDSDLVLKMELKDVLIRKMRLRVWSYSQGEYFYVLGPSELTLKYKTYTALRHEGELEA